MVHFRGKSLLPARIDRLGKGSTNIGRHDLRDRAQFSQRPKKICYRKPAAFPICDRFFAAKTIKINRHINIAATKIADKGFEMFAPVISQNRASSLSIFRRPIVCPWMYFKNARTFSATVAENLVRPPAFEIAATPNRDVLHM
jgi:hypothetical protein